MATSRVSLILPLIEAQHNRRAGEKAINLSKLIAAHFAVPRGFVVSADAYRSHLWASGARDATSDAATAEAREEIRTAILSSDIPSDIWGSILDSYQRLALQVGFENPMVAVRSSALEEGSPETSFPGAYESILNVSGHDALATAVKRVWASLWSGKAAAYRTRYNIDAEPAMAVIVQQMMEARWSGTALTADPVTGDRNRVVVSCSSLADPSDLSCHVVDLRNPSALASGDDRCKSPGEGILTLLAEKAIVIEQTLCSSVELEWAYDGDRLWVLQARPVSSTAEYFPVGEEASQPENILTRIASGPISFFAMENICACDRISIYNGYAYEKACNTEFAKPGKRESEGFRLLEEWEARTAKGLKYRAEQIISLDRANVENEGLVSRTKIAIEDVKLAEGWLDKSRRFGSVFRGDLEKSLGSVLDTPFLFEGLPGGATMRDAKLQELADSLSAAEETGKIDNHGWRRDYRLRIEAFAQDYGYSFAAKGQIYDPASWDSWIENTDTVFRMIAALRNRGSRPSLVTLHCAAEENYRRKASEIVKMTCNGKRSRVEKLLRLSRGWLALGNDCEMMLALTSTGLRLAMMEIGNRLRRAEAVADPSDVFYLNYSEITRALDNSAETATLIAHRKHEMWLDQRLSAPKFLPSKRPDYKTGGAYQLEGSHLCPGTVTGRVRIARSVEEAGEIEAGEVLVVESATLAWTPFLAVAGGLVTEEQCIQPGIESVIRTYGIPAIIGCKEATTLLRNARRVSLDAETGTAEIS